MIRNSFDFEENIGSNQEYKMYNGSEPSCRLIYDRKSKVAAQWSDRRAVVSLCFVSFQYDLRVGIVIEKMKNK